MLNGQVQFSATFTGWKQAPASIDYGTDRGVMAIDVGSPPAFDLRHYNPFSPNLEHEEK